MKKENLPYILILIAAVLWGSLGISIRLLSSFGLTSLQIVVTRFLMASFIFAAAIMLIDKKLLKIEKSDIKYFVIFAIFCLLAYNICLAITMQLTSLSVSVALLYTAPIWAMLLSMPIFHEQFTKTKAIAIGLCVLGTSLASGVFTSDDGLRLSSFGLLMGILSGIGYGAYGVFAKKLLGRYHTLTTSLYSFLFAGIGGLIFCRPSNVAQIVSAHPIVLLYILGGAIFCCVLPFGLYTYALNFVEASKAAIIVSIEPVAATLFGLFVFNEPVTVSVAIGTFFILAAVITLRRSGG